jgi:hypothetical protein
VQDLDAWLDARKRKSTSETLSSEVIET